MKPEIDGTEFGSITVDGKRYGHDVIIRLSGEVEARDKSLSREKYGTSHKVSAAEARQIYDEGAQQLIVGSGQNGRLDFTPQGRCFLQDKDCSLSIHRTPQALQVWNSATGKVIGMFHVTC